jgi:Spy/CpxP family protein refolding chaperone
MKKFLLLLMLLAPLSGVQAQPGQGAGPRRAEMQAAKIGFFTRFLALTEEEAQKFWPVYNKYEEEREAHRKKMMGLRLNKETTDELTEKEAEALVEQYLQLRQEEVELEKRYYASVKKVLPAPKVAKLFQAERQFQREILRSMRQEGRPGMNRR